MGKESLKKTKLVWTLAHLSTTLGLPVVGTEESAPLWHLLCLVTFSSSIFFLSNFPLLVQQNLINTKVKQTPLP